MRSNCFSTYNYFLHFGSFSLLYGRFNFQFVKLLSWPTMFECGFFAAFSCGLRVTQQNLIISEIKISQFSCAVFGGNVNELFRFWNGEMCRFSVMPLGRLNLDLGNGSFMTIQFFGWKCSTLPLFGDTVWSFPCGWLVLNSVQADLGLERLLGMNANPGILVWASRGIGSLTIGLLDLMIWLGSWRRLGTSVLNSGRHELDLKQEAVLSWPNL